MDISVIIVNWNTRDLLIECLQSLDRQKGSFQKEVIVVDNGSSDGSQQAVKTAFPEVKIIENNANFGFAKANNIGIMKSSGHYVCLVNSDVVVMDNCLQRLKTFMDLNLNVGISGPKILNPDLTTQDSCRTFPSLWNNLSPALGLDKIFKNVPLFSGEHMFNFNHDISCSVDYLAGCFFIVRRKAIDEIGFLDERYFIYQEEVDWCKRFKNAGWNIVYFPEAVAIHYHGASSAKDPLRFTTEQIKSKIKYWKKHHGQVAATLYLLIIILHHGIRLATDGVLYFISSSKKRIISQRMAKHFFYFKYIFMGKYGDK